MDDTLLQKLQEPKIDFALKKLCHFCDGRRYLEEPFRDCPFCKDKLPHRKHSLAPLAIIGFLPVVAILVFDKIPDGAFILAVPFFYLALIIIDSKVSRWLDGRERRRIHQEIDRNKVMIQRVTRSLLVTCDDLERNLLGPESQLGSSQELLDGLLQRCHAYQHEVRMNGGGSEEIQEITSCIARLYGLRQQLREYRAKVEEAYQGLSHEARNIYSLAELEGHGMNPDFECQLLLQTANLLDTATAMMEKHTEAAKKTDLRQVLQSSCEQTRLELPSVEKALKDFLSAAPNCE